MKYASILFALALIGFAGIANATERNSFSFDYNNHNSYYACSYAEGQTAHYLEVLGADSISVKCSGGIDHDMLLPVSVNAEFNHNAKGERTVVLKGRESCDFNVKLINTILNSIDHGSVNAQSTCWDSKGTYRFEINLN